jgi:hypothetical protein
MAAESYRFSSETLIISITLINTRLIKRGEVSPLAKEKHT